MTTTIVVMMVTKDSFRRARLDGTNRGKLENARGPPSLIARLRGILEEGRPEERTLFVPNTDGGG
jgi:hypothetical protein